MGLLAKIFGGVPRVEMEGIRLDCSKSCWEISGETDVPALLLALPDVLPDGSILYFEGGSPDGELLEFLKRHEVPEQAHVAYGTIWPRPRVFHLPATLPIIEALAELARSFATPELAIHFHVYRGQLVLLEWHDSFSQPMLLSMELSEEKVRKFADRLGMKCEIYNFANNSEAATPTTESLQQ